MKSLPSIDTIEDKHGPAVPVTPVFIPKNSLGFFCSNLCVFSHRICAVFKGIIGADPHGKLDRVDLRSDFE
jgi:hypothetical protein